MNLDDVLFNRYLKQRRQKDESNYASGVEQWMMNNPDLIEQLKSGDIDPMELNLDDPSLWRMIAPTLGI